MTTTETLPDTCDGCNKPIVRWSPTNPPDNGLALDLSGSYYGFTDNYDPTTFSGRIDLCHDCVLLMIVLFPTMREKFGKGCHYSPADEPPCCTHAFSQDDERNVLYPNDTLTGWVIKERGK